MADVVATQEPLVGALSNIGVSGVTALIAWLWVKKDKQYTDLSRKVMEILEKNVLINTELKTSIRANTKASEKLDQTITTKVFDLLNDHGK